MLNLAQKKSKLPILVSLPQNDIALAKAAIEAGVSGVKIHLNAFHRASGTTFGNFQQELPFLKQLAALEIPKFVMVGQDEVPTESEMDELSAMGFEGFNCYLKHLQPHLLRSALRPILALEHGYQLSDVDRLTSVPGAWIEASIVDGADYGKPLSQDDLIHYREISECASARVTPPPALIVPSQKKFLPTDLPRLREAGVSALLVGIIVTGRTPESMKAAIQSFVEAAN